MKNLFKRITSVLIAVSLSITFIPIFSTISKAAKASNVNFEKVNYRGNTKNIKGSDVARKFDEIMEESSLDGRLQAYISAVNYMANSNKGSYVDEVPKSIRISDDEAIVYVGSGNDARANKVAYVYAVIDTINKSTLEIKSYLVKITCNGGVQVFKDPAIEGASVKGLAKFSFTTTNISMFGNTVTDNGNEKIDIPTFAKYYIGENKNINTVFMQDFNNGSIKSSTEYNNINSVLDYKNGIVKFVFSTEYSRSYEVNSEHTITSTENVYDITEDHELSEEYYKIGLDKDAVANYAKQGTSQASGDDKVFADLLLATASYSKFNSAQAYKEHYQKWLDAIAKISKDGFVYPFYKDYLDVLDSVWQGQSIKDGTSASVKTPEAAKKSNIDTSEPFKVMSHALAMSIQNTDGSLMELITPTATVQFTPGTPEGTESLNTYWDQLSNYEKHLLKTEYEYTVKNLNNISGINPSKVTLSEPTSTSYSSRDAEEFASAHPELIDSIKSVINPNDSKLDYNSYNVRNVIRNCNMLGQYIIGIALYGGGEENNNELYNIYDAGLDALVNADNYKMAGINDKMFPIYLPQHLPLFETDGIGRYTVIEGSSSWDSYVHFLNNVTYGFEVSEFSDDAIKDKLTSKDVADWFSGKAVSHGSLGQLGSEGDSSGASGISSIDVTNLQKAEIFGSNFNETQINVIRSIIELADLCKFFGIATVDDTGKFNFTQGMWSTTIDTYLGLYQQYQEQFDAIRLNTNFFDVSEAGVQSIEEPLGEFFSLADKRTTEQWNKGFAQSALYTPLVTNLYDKESVNGGFMDNDYLADFYYKYAFFRKAVYINTNNSAIVDTKVKGKQADSNTRVATLSDLLNYDRDIILTVDDNFYNAKDISEATSKLDYTAMRNGSKETIDDNDKSTVEKLVDKAGDALSGALELLPEQVLKTGNTKYYSETLAEHATKLGQEASTLASMTYDQYLYSEDKILGTNTYEGEGCFDGYEYDMNVPYGVVSAIYRSADLYNEILMAETGDNAIFKSSKGICNVPGSGKKDWQALYNYVMLANLNQQIRNNSDSMLDLDSPIFCDLFGNIVTESGLVIIPAAANITLCGDSWDPYTVGWAELYNNGNRITIDDFPNNDQIYSWLVGYEYDRNDRSKRTIFGKGDGEVDPETEQEIMKTPTTTVNENITGVGVYGLKPNNESAGGFFIIDHSGQLNLRTDKLSGPNGSVIIEWDMINKNADMVRELFFDDAYYNKAQNIYSHKITNLITEVLRGAPIEKIDYDYEGLVVARKKTAIGVSLAQKLEELTDSIVVGVNGSATGGNTAFTMPNINFMAGVEYVMMYVYKIMFAVLLFALAISIYRDATASRLGIASMAKFIVTIFMVIVCISIVPMIISESYTNANKHILTTEAGEVSMLNYNKEFDGAEVGVQEIRTPETTTKLYLKLDNINIPWWTIMNNVLFNNSMDTVSDLYKDELNKNVYLNQEGVKLVANGAYIDIQDLYDSTTIVYQPSTNILINESYTTKASEKEADENGSKPNDVRVVASFASPYYVILDQLITNINEYNVSQGIDAMSYTVGNNGHVITYDLVKPYISSTEFLDDGFDILGMNNILQTGINLNTYTEGIFTNDDFSRMQASLWYPSNDMSRSVRREKIEELYSFARNWVLNNKDTLGKVADEVYVKQLALQCAIKYNQLFGVHQADAIEIIDMDSRDIARFTVDKPANVYKYYAYSFARFTYERGGGLAVILMCIYMIILWLTSFVKPALMIIILGLMIINVIGRRLLFDKETKAIEGFLIGSGLLILTNYAYSFMLKATLSVASLGLGSFTSVIFAIVIQVLYIVALLGIVKIEISDWKNSGFYEFTIAGQTVGSTFSRIGDAMRNRFIAKDSDFVPATASDGNTSSMQSNITVEEMMARDAQRLRNAGQGNRNVDDNDVT